ncbi:hypothetical protein QE406_001159 [Microbacterium testaceum]|nr:hypothetical protein [Microbacterium testaceum]MDQ1115150.1 hypothetical protein [Microbacterium testaceum]
MLRAHRDVQGHRGQHRPVHVGGQPQIVRERDLDGLLPERVVHPVGQQLDDVELKFGMAGFEGTDDIGQIERCHCAEAPDAHPPRRVLGAQRLDGVVDGRQDATAALEQFDPRGRQLKTFRPATDQ